VAWTHNTVSEKQNFRSLIDDLNLADEVAAPARGSYLEER
jgi:hypothetical protein